jgi:hypothetical protein
MLNSRRQLMLSNNSGPIIVGGFQHVELENHKWFMILLYLFIECLGWR